MQDNTRQTPAAPNEISDGMKKLANEWLAERGFATKPIQLKQAHLQCFSVLYGSVLHGLNAPYAVFQFFAPQCLASDKVREARRRSYILHNRFGEIFYQTWMAVVGDKNYILERIENEPVLGPQGQGSDSWCLRAWGRPLTESNAVLFSTLLEKFDEALRPLLELMLR
jgi:hypothetical protein